MEDASEQLRIMREVLGPISDVHQEVAVHQQRNWHANITPIHRDDLARRFVAVMAHDCVSAYAKQVEVAIHAKSNAMAQYNRMMAEATLLLDRKMKEEKKML